MIIQVIGTLRGGGAEKIALTLHKGFKKLGKKSKLIVTSEKIDYKIKNEDIIIETDMQKIFKYNPGLVIAHMQDASQKLSKFDLNIWNVIHTTLSYRAKRKNIFNRFKYLRELKKVYNNKNLITVSNGVKKDILNNIKIKPKNIKTIYNPFDIVRKRKSRGKFKKTC